MLSHFITSPHPVVVVVVVVEVVVVVVVVWVVAGSGKRNFRILQKLRNKPPGLGDSGVHRAVSIGSPSQASEVAALQLRNLNLLPAAPHEQLDMHSDHSPQSAQTPAAAADKT